MSFYDDVLRELLVALGAALFLGNLLALIRRRPPAAVVEDGNGSVTRPPVGRTIAYLVIGLVVAVWGIASLAAG